MPPQAQAPSASPQPSSQLLEWKFTDKAMNVMDLSRDDDFLSHLLVEKLGTSGIPLHVHKMDSTRRLPRVPADQLLEIVRRLVSAKKHDQAIKTAVDSLLNLAGVRYYIQEFTKLQINAFATHASRYLALYSPFGNIEIAHTQRYSHKTGKSELCVLATRPLAPGTKLTDLTGSLADLTDEEDRELKRTDLRQSQICRDFSVIHSRALKKNHLFLGPARFVNHDCANNCELSRNNKVITFVVMRPIAAGEEVTAHYGDDYFGRNNRDCLCETCEKTGSGGYRPRTQSENPDADEQSDVEAPSRPDTPALSANVNVNERRTRRGVYHVVEEEEEDLPPEIIKIEREESRAPSALSSLSPSPSSAAAAVARPSTGLITPSPDPETPSTRPPLSLSTTIPLPPSAAESAPSSEASSRRPKFEPVISTRAQKARVAELAKQQQQHSQPAPMTPPLSDDAATPRNTRSRSRRSTPAAGAGPMPGAVSRTGSRGASSSKAPMAASNGSGARGSVLGRSLSRVSARSGEAKAPSKKGKEKESNVPTCSTCGNVLPVISLNGEIVWGDFDERGRKKKEEQQCPRCLRHYAIYQMAWPMRLGTAENYNKLTHVPTPRSLTPAPGPSSSTAKLLKAVDHKLQQKVLASSSSKRASTSRASSISAPNKRRKVEDVGKESKRAKKDGDASAAALVGRSRSGRTVVPSVKLRESAEPPKRPRGRPPKISRQYGSSSSSVPGKKSTGSSGSGSSATANTKQHASASAPVTISATPAVRSSRQDRAESRAKKFLERMPDPKLWERRPVQPPDWSERRAKGVSESRPRADAAAISSSPLSSAGEVEEEVAAIGDSPNALDELSLPADEDLMPVSPLSPPSEQPDVMMEGEEVEEEPEDLDEEVPMFRPPAMMLGGMRPSFVAFTQMKWAEREQDDDPDPGRESEDDLDPPRAVFGLRMSPQLPAAYDERVDEVEILEVSTATSSGGPVTPEDHTSDDVIQISDDSDDERDRITPVHVEVDSDIEVLENYEEPASVFIRPKSMSSLWRPSPMELARRRWAQAERWNDDSGRDSDIEIEAY